MTTHEPLDLTRWNRSGLQQFTYVDGNAAQFLEELRKALKERFPNSSWAFQPGPEADVERDTEHEQFEINRKVVEQYYGERRDLVWEIARGLARAAHVTGAHVDAAANEGFLRTATQWDNVRRLVELIDYHPAPATSALVDLVLIAKDSKQGVLKRGFQVKHSPPDSGPPIVFETLDDLEINHELNALRPLGWDEPSGTFGGVPPAGSEPKFGKIAERPAKVIWGIDEAPARLRNMLERSQVRDLVDFDVDKAGEREDRPWLRELKGKAIALARFHLDAGWDALMELPLAKLAGASAAGLAEASGKTPEEAQALKWRLEAIRGFLVPEEFAKRTLADLAVPLDAGPELLIETLWEFPKKPKVEEGDVALVFDPRRSDAQAVSIGAPLAEPGDEPSNRIHVEPSPVQRSWLDWSVGGVKLWVAPRLEREPWLNGTDVVRTAAPHGLAAGAKVAWFKGSSWQFADVVEADDWNLRLLTFGDMPPSGTPLVEARPVESSKFTAEVAAIGMVADPDELVEVVDKSLTKAIVRPDILDIPESAAGDVPFPGSMDFGSFLFPTPMLPADLVKAAVEILLSMGAMVIPSTGEPVFKMLENPLEVAGLILTAAETAGATLNVTVPAGEEPRDVLAKLLNNPAGSDSVLFKEVAGEMPSKPLLVVPKEFTTKATVASPDPLYVLKGSPGNIAVGDWAVAAFSDGLRGLRVKKIEQLPLDGQPAFAVEFLGLNGPAGEFRALHGEFRAFLDPIPSVSEVELDSPEIEMEPPAGLRPGRRVLVEGGDEPSPTTVIEVHDDRIVLDPPVAGIAKGKLVIRGNVIVAGHGASKPEKVLGTGSLPQPVRRLELDVTNVASVPDATFPRGTRMDIDVVIEGARWQQVPRLNESGPTDTHYSVGATEKGQIAIQFGDGKHGRFVPLGTPNVRVRYRVGAGRSGNLDPGSLIKPVKPNPLVADVLQPRASGGGEDRESVRNMRENAPATLLALERSVSLEDFENLASSHNQVWRARAFHLPLVSRFRERVRVVVVPSGGRELERPLRKELTDYLTSNAIPGVAVEVDSFSPRPVQLKVEIRVDQNVYEPPIVAVAVRNALLERLSIERRAIGQPLFISEVYHVVEEVRGVSDSQCAFVGDADASQFPAAGTINDEDVVHLGTDPDDLVISVEAYTL